MTVTVHDQSLVADLRAALAGDVIDRADHRYEHARRVWNGLIDRRPAVIARCTTTADVVAAGLVIDLSAMTSVTVDPAARTARVGPGARWADVNAATQRHGLVVPGGEVSETGVAGLRDGR